MKHQKSKHLLTGATGILLLLIGAVKSFSQQTHDSTKTKAYLLAQGKKEVKSGVITLGVATGIIILSRLLPAEERHGFDFTPQGKDLLLLVGIGTAVTGLVVWIKGSSKVSIANTMIGFKPCFIKPAVRQFLPSLTMSISLGRSGPGLKKVQQAYAPSHLQPAF